MHAKEDVDLTGCGAMRAQALIRSLKDKFVFLHIKPHNVDFPDHTQCSTALSCRTLQRAGAPC